MPQMKEKDKTSEKQLKEVEIGNLPEKSASGSPFTHGSTTFTGGQGEGNNRSHTCGS